MTQSQLDPESFQRLQLLAQRNCISTTFWDWHGNLCEVAAPTLIRVLRSLGTRLSNQPTVADLDQALTDFEDQIWMRTLPPSTIVRVGCRGEVHVHVPDGEQVTVEVIYEDGQHANLNQIDNWDPPREVNGQLRGRASFALEEWLPLGYHTLKAHVGTGEVATGHLIVVPQRIDPPVWGQIERAWGISSQLYSVRSEQCWGMGDTGVLEALNQMCAEAGADFHLINPLHAPAPAQPIEPSPYLPVTRQFLAAMYINPFQIEEYSQLSASDRLFIRECHEQSRGEDTDRAGLIDRDRSWRAKREALYVIFKVARTREREDSWFQFKSAKGEGLRQFALWCALVEQFGMPLAAPYDDRDSEEVAEFAKLHRNSVEFHMWLQWVISEQLNRAQQRAQEAGMQIGIMADLAVGVHPFGSEVWSTPQYFAPHMTVGAPPDMYSQQGQNWSQPPWNPQALAQAGYQPLRTMVQASLSLCGALRIDHILGLFRLWWIPQGMGAQDGAYVHYDHEAMVGVLLLEAQRSGAIIIGEDLGTVEPWVRGYLTDRGVLGTSIVWFERDEAGQPLAADHYRREVLAAVNTHDLPPTCGYMRGVQTTLRDELGLLVESVDDVRAQDQAELDQMASRLRQWGLLGDEQPTEVEFIAALYRYICATPARLLAVSLVDITGDTRPQNLPGTHREYPNWQIPLSDNQGREVTVEQLRACGFATFAQVMNEGR